MLAVRVRWGVLERTYWNVFPESTSEGRRESLVVNRPGARRTTQSRERRRAHQGPPCLRDDRGDELLVGARVGKPCVCARGEKRFPPPLWGGLQNDSPTSSASAAAAAPLVVTTRCPVGATNSGPELHPTRIICPGANLFRCTDFLVV